MQSESPSLRHGGARTGLMTREYKAWSNMIARCEQVGHASYPRYGGRGIRVHPSWRHSYATFLADMGPRPTSSHSLDRIDNNGDYGPGNCRWATPVEQSRNTRTSRLVTAHGRTQCLAAWAEEAGLHPATVRNRLSRGWSVESALARPARVRSARVAPLPEDLAIAAAHPLKTGRHDLYMEAMRMVGAKRSKGALVELVCWLLTRVEDAEGKR